MQIVRREVIGSWSARVIQRRSGHYMVVQKPGEPTVVHFLADSIEQSMRKADRFVRHMEGQT